MISYRRRHNRLYIWAYCKHTMPLKGFRSITVSHTVYERFNSAYQTRKDDLAAKGTKSLSGYISNMLDEALNENEAARQPGRLRKIHAESGRVVVMDAESGRVAEVVMRDGESFCHMCNSGSCIHAGFAYATPAFY